MTSAPPTKKPALTPAEKRRRKARRAWIPTIVIGILIIVAIVTAVFFQASGINKTITPPAGNSKFNIAGLKVINGAADVQIDVRKPLTAASVGLPADSSRTFGPFNDIALEVDLTGSPGQARLFVDTMHVVTSHGYVTSIGTDTTDSGFLFIRTQLSSLSDLGLTTKQMADFENAMPNGAGGPDSHFSLPFGTGNALGVPTAVNVSCNGAKGCTVSTKTTLLTK